MLTYEKHRILSAICDKKNKIRHQEEKLERIRQKLESEQRFIPRRIMEFLMRHYQSGIQGARDDIDDLEEDLLITDMAIRSQARDNRIIESNENLPFPRDLETEDETLSEAPARTSLFSRDFFNLGRLREMIDSFTSRDDKKPTEKDRTPLSSDKR